MKIKTVALAAFAVAGLLTGAQASAQEKLTVWWVKGFYKAEDDALFAAIKKYEAKNKNVKIELSQYPIQDMIPKTVAALDAGTPPDVAYADVYDFQVTASWANDGKLEDISSVINPIRARFAPNTVETTFLLNSKENKRAYYAFPIKQQTMHIQYWGDMLADAGFKESDIPTNWKDYWSFWCDKVQPAHRQKSGQRSFGIGNPMGVDSSDSFYSFLTFADAHNVKMVSDSGKLLVDDPDVRKGLIAAMTDYTSFYGKGCTPPSSTSWKDPDNNVAFHNKTTVLTHNATISIAAKWLDDKNNARAKDFVTFMLQEENLMPYVEGSLGRWFPVTKAGQQSKFWQDDPHRKAVHKQFMDGTSTFEFTKNFRFTQLNNENVWAKAMNRVINEKVPVDKAVDEMIARIKQVAAN